MGHAIHDYTYREMRERVEAASIPTPECGCWVWELSWNAGGYGRMSCRGMEAHRYSWIAYNGRPVPPGMHVCHKCDTPACVNPAHLFLGTARDNAIDRNSKQRGSTLANGTRFHTKYSEEQVADVRLMAASGATNARIAAKHGMSRPYVHYVLAGRSRHTRIGVKQ